MHWLVKTNYKDLDVVNCPFPFSNTDFVLLSGRLLTALVSEYLEWAQLGHTLKVYLPECNLVSVLDFLFHFTFA